MKDQLFRHWRGGKAGAPYPKEDRQGGPGSDRFEDSVRILRDSIRATADRPDAFWARQRAAIGAGVRREMPGRRSRGASLWAPAAMAAVICLFLFFGNGREAFPDFAAGADQALLIDVELALRRYCPEALAPAEILVEEIR